ncbi:MAG: PASTA domain-containing protein [Acidimicrobiales bacterium]|jgi:serine/threonine-protein kinase
MSSTEEQVGRVFGGRYRLLALVGAGASAQVFAAQDTRLGRRVAIKLLHPALAGDATFLKKFQAEARLAASLNHRNVLHVYDWGDEDGVPYLVLEFLGGGSLRSLLDTGYLLSPQQAAAVGVEAAHGLAYAHRRGLVHRDIKPANLLFDDDGRLLVADFGLARALAEAAITEPLGTVMGTARYASPEQVEGHPVDDRTDVYSLALTLYESVTGRVPFAGETTVATLMARVGAVLPPARELGPLAPVLAQAAISEPLARLDAATLASELELLLRELGPPEPLPLAKTDLTLPDAPSTPGRDPTERLGLPGSPMTAVAPVRSGAEIEEPTLPGVRRIVPAPEPSPPRQRRSRRRNRWLPWLLVVLVLAVGAGVGVLMASRTILNRDTVPKVAGLNFSSADSAIHKAGLVPEVSAEQYSSSAPRGVVIRQTPQSGSQEKSGSVVKIVISEGPHPTTVPSMSGMTETLAAAALSRAHLVAHFSKRYSETIAFGKVVSSGTLAGTKLYYGDTVDVVISEGPAPQTIPSDLGGGVLTWAQAETDLGNLRLKPVEVLEYSTVVPAGYVITTKPAPGLTVPGHSSVQVIVSEGPPYVKLPSLYADSVDTAEQELTSLGLKWQFFGPPGAHFVLTQIPSAGTLVRVGTTIDIYLY